MRSLTAFALCVACTPLTQMPPPRPSPIHDGTVAADPLHANRVDALHTMAKRTLATLVVVLDADKKRSVEHVTLDFTPGAHDVNAYATCGGRGRPAITVSDGLLEIARQLALARATDEVYGTDHARAYMDWSKKHPGEIKPADPTYGDDSRTRDLATSIFIDELAFVLGHELAHHYLGHLGCDERGGNVEDVARIALHDIPLFSQAAELAADAGGVTNTLEAGRTRDWTEGGAILVLQFFRSQQTLEGVLLAFIQTHPLAEVRLPTVTATADVWRATNGHLPL